MPGDPGIDVSPPAHLDSRLDDVPTVYVGGGTPTVLGDELVRLMAGLRAAIPAGDLAGFVAEFERRRAQGDIPPL